MLGVYQLLFVAETVYDLALEFDLLSNCRVPL